MKHVIYTVFLLAIVVSCNSGKHDALRVACASNLRFVMPEITEKFASEFPSSPSIHISYGSTGTLRTQIENGADYDLFLSADDTTAKYLIEKALASQFDYLISGNLALCGYQKSLSPEWQKILNTPKLHFAIANPDLAPYGVAAKRYLKESGMYEQIKPHLVFCESVQAVNKLVSLGAAHYGITSNSASGVFKNRLFKPLDWSNAQNVLQQTMVLLDQNNEAANEFGDFLLSEPAQDIFRKMGYSSVK